MSHHVLFAGRIVNMSSGMGRRCAPSRASYCITKYGVEALSDCLRFEMRNWDVNVIIVEPGNFINGIQTLISH
jgi:3-hydroxybutyrate dehydrogenase